MKNTHNFENFEVISLACGSTEEDGENNFEKIARLNLPILRTVSNSQTILVTFEINKYLEMKVKSTPFLDNFILQEEKETQNEKDIYFNSTTFHVHL